jgi:hypothetical protein
LSIERWVVGRSGIIEIIFELRGDGVIPVKHCLLEVTPNHQPRSKIKRILALTLSFLQMGFLGSLK